MTEEEGESPSGSSVGSCLEVVISLFSGAVRLQSRAHLPPSVAELCRTDCTTKTLLLFISSLSNASLRLSGTAEHSDHRAFCSAFAALRSSGIRLVFLLY